MNRAAIMRERMASYFLSLLFHALSQRTIGKTLPRDSDPLTESDYVAANKICRWIECIIHDRDQYIKMHRLDPAINNPAANWSKANSFYDGYRALATGKREHLNMLRVFSQVFTGHFLGIRQARGLPVPATLPANLDGEVLKNLNRNLAPWIIRYQRVVKLFPELGKLTPPRKFGESGFLINDVIVNHDTYAYMERLALLMDWGIIDRLRSHERPVILEIGPGYGGLAYFIKQLIPRCTYICVDLPESLIFSAVYLSCTSDSYSLATPGTSISVPGAHEVMFLPNYMFHQLIGSGLCVDLAINTLSMSEMTESQVSCYCEGLAALLGDTGIFFEQNQNNQHLGLLFAPNIIGRYFGRKQTSNPKLRLTQGSAAVWMNHQAPMAVF